MEISCCAYLCERPYGSYFAVSSSGPLAWPHRIALAAMKM